jgi:hypothetical protein
MSYTMQQIVDIAREPLNDAKKTRYSDARLLRIANAAVMRAQELRPDLLFGSGSYVPAASLALGDAFPLPDQYAQTLADYIGGRAELKDDDAANSGRAGALMQLFMQALTT